MVSGYSCIPLNLAYYEDWDALCSESRDAWFWHTTRWLEYNLVYRPEIHAISHSFLLFYNSKLVAICPIIIQDMNLNEFSGKSISFPSGHGVLPAIASDTSKEASKSIWKECSEMIDSIAERNYVKHASFRISPLTESGQDLIELSEKLNILRRSNYIESIALTLIIDLNKDKHTLKNEMRKGHRYDVKRADTLFRTKGLTRDRYLELMNSV